MNPWQVLEALKGRGFDTTELEAGAQTSYMCEETGIGSGALWRERDLFLTPAEAQVAADAKAADIQVDIEHLLKDLTAKGYVKS